MSSRNYYCASYYCATDFCSFDTGTSNLRTYNIGPANGNRPFTAQSNCRQHFS